MLEPPFIVASRFRQSSAGWLLSFQVDAMTPYKADVVGFTALKNNSPYPISCWVCDDFSNQVPGIILNENGHF